LNLILIGHNKTGCKVTKKILYTQARAFFFQKKIVLWGLFAKKMVSYWQSDFFLVILQAKMGIMRSC